MAEDEDVIIPSSGNTALDPTRALSGLVRSSSLEEKANAVANAASKSFGDPNKFVSRPKGGDSGKSELENYWKRRHEKAAEDLANGIKPRPKTITASGGGGGGGGERPSGIKRSGKFGISNSTAKDYGTMRFKSPVFKDAAMATYSCIFPLNGFLPQVCGPFRPITMETIGGFPQSMAQEASNNGGPVNSDEV